MLITTGGTMRTGMGKHTERVKMVLKTACWPALRDIPISCPSGPKRHTPLPFHSSMRVKATLHEPADHREVGHEEAQLGEAWENLHGLLQPHGDAAGDSD